ncbi:cobalt import ATP-binding protein cbiO 7 [Fictibacillus macauensis ZFHKF-1]|uniref:ABC transporter ATP-binding protein n=1 Tax=Fictibacillus macauensis ZFHKF-1 TaxID=1196324 RepID=I8AE30_9BACL|nr:ATP-binding cassette domain-containing protein [Fictibacillus macauensis]EIT83847.1 cobalt import ATP-binding protein cbiO 7 [Fictibacillus macauensis ZFHKF-1]
MNEHIVSFENVSYVYSDGTVALNDLSFSFEYGKKIALIGNNGAGKSTLFLLLNGILKPTKGTIYYKGSPLSYGRKALQKLRQEVGIVFQNPDTQLFSSSVYEDVKFGPRNLGLKGEALTATVQHALEETETVELQEKPPHFLSVGQKKRAAIAGIIAMKPDLMVFDEPTAGLDPYYAKHMMTLLHTLHHNERTILLSTHNVDLAYEWADDVIILHNGTILANGAPAVVFQNEEALRRSHLEKPFVVETFDRLRESQILSGNIYPKSKDELYSWIATRKQTASIY